MSTISSDGYIQGGPDAVVTLVPGTWAGQAAWIRADSLLSKALTTAGCQVVPFGWSHRNSYLARTRAAVRLAEQIQGQIKQNPGARQWIVAHSHGGNIALHAVRHLQDSCIDAPRVSTVTLATPFIHGRRRARSGWWPVFVLAIFGPIVIGSAWSALAKGPHWGDWLVFGFGALVAGDALLCIAGACMHPGFRWRGSLRWLRRTVTANPEDWHRYVIGAVLRGEFIRPGYRSELIARVHSPTVEPGDLFVVRAAGDEASASLATGQFLGWISALLNRRLTNLWFWAVILILVLGSVVAALYHIASPGLGLTVFIYLFLATGLLAVFTVAVMLFAAVPFGWDGPFLSIFASCSAEAAPPGQATILQLEPFAGTENRGLAHSGLYRSEPVINRIVTLICGSPTAKAPVQPPGSRRRGRAPRASRERPKPRQIPSS
jgi:hypothetical protein